MRHRNITHLLAPSSALRGHRGLCLLATSVARDEEFIAFALADTGEACTLASNSGGAHDLPALGAYWRENGDDASPR